MAVDQKTLEMLHTEPDVTEGLDLSWMDQHGPLGMSAKPGRRGLTLEEVNRGAYGAAPEWSQSATAAVRGGAARVGVPRIGYKVAKKSDIWSENAAMLYEEAVQRQWSSATDIPWDELTPLPDDVERAYSQFCTFLTEVEFIAGDTPGQWLPKINSEHHEVKLFLLTQIMDEARHLDVFRKRAFANGGGLLSSLPQDGLRVIIEAKDFTEMSAIMHVAAEGFVQSLFRMGEYIGQNDAEKRIFRMCGQDESRHLGFGVMHLKYVMENEPWRREELNHYLDKVEGTLAPDPFDSDPINNAVFESLAILMGGGVKNIDKGVNMGMQVQRKRVNEYMHRLNVAGLGDRRDRMRPMLKQFLDN